MSFRSEQAQADGEMRLFLLVQICDDTQKELLLVFERVCRPVNSP